MAEDRKSDNSSMHGSSHLDEDTLDAYVLGRLSELESQAVDAHLILCEVCRHRAERLEGFVEGLRREVAQRPSGLINPPPARPKNGESTDPTEHGDESNS